MNKIFDIFKFSLTVLTIQTIYRKLFFYNFYTSSGLLVVLFWSPSGHRWKSESVTDGPTKQPTYQLTRVGAADAYASKTSHKLRMLSSVTRNCPKL